MFKTLLIMICVLIVNAPLCQEASDYYGRHVQELQEKIWVKDTILTHVGGFTQSYYESQGWAFKNKDPHIKSVISVDSLGTVQIALHSDCRVLRASGSVIDYYMALTSHSTSMKIEFWNIDPKSKDCDALFRQSLLNKVIDLLSDFSDSTKYVHVPCKGFVQTQIHPLLPIAYIQSMDSIDKLFAKVKADSARTTDSINHREDSITTANVASRQIEIVLLDTVAVQRVVDSLSRIFDADSIAIRHCDLVMFKGQPSISCHGKIDIDTRLQCLKFLLDNKLRTILDVQKYLTLLQKYCNDKADMIRAVIPIVSDNLKYKAVAVYHHAQDSSAKVQNFGSKIVLSEKQ
jgi:hypothetical protein